VKIHIGYRNPLCENGYEFAVDVPAGSRSTEHDEMRLLHDPRAGPPVELQGVGELL